MPQWYTGVCRRLSIEVIRAAALRGTASAEAGNHAERIKRSKAKPYGKAGGIVLVVPTRRAEWQQLPRGG